MPDEPVALLSDATTARQRCVRTTLGRAAADAALIEPGAPTLVVIGPVVGLGALLAARPAERARTSRRRTAAAGGRRARRMTMTAALPLLPDSAPFAPEHIEALNAVMARTNAEQRQWLSGFLAGYHAATAGTPLAAPRPRRARGSRSRSSTPPSWAMPRASAPT